MAEPASSLSALLPVSSRPVAGNAVETVDARRLHAFLGVGRDFSNWIKDRISAYGFEIGRDYVTEARSPELASGNRGAAVTYFLALDMAKELAMVERTPKGKEARAYFIECERIAKTAADRPADPIALLNDPVAMRGLLLTYTEKVLALQEEVAVLEPKAAALERMAESDGSFSVTVSAKLLSVSPKWLFGFMAEHGWIYRRPVTQEWTAYQSRIDSKHLEQRKTTVIQHNGSERTVSHCVVLPRGLALLAEAINRSDTSNEAACKARKAAVSAALAQH